MTEITQMPLQFLNPLSQCPLEPLRVRNTRLKAHASIIRLPQKPFKFGDMAAETFNNCVRRLLKFFF